MKLIKYRVWCKDKNEWEKNECMLSPNGILIEVRYDYLMELKKDTHIVEQFTGLCDKNGVEIYEGDIITWSWRKKPQLVSWNKERMGFDPIADEEAFLAYCEDENEKETENIEEFKVIGNIHETR